MLSRHTKDLLSKFKGTLKAGETLTVGLTCDVKSPMGFHIDVFAHLYPKEASRIALVRSGMQNLDPHTFEPDTNISICFKNKADSDFFAKWWEEYAGRFTNDMTQHFLPGVENNRVDGYMVPHPIPDGNVFEKPRERQFLDEWVWIVKNTSGKVWWMWTHWVFENDAEAVHFKMKREDIEEEMTPVYEEDAEEEYNEYDTAYGDDYGDYDGYKARTILDELKRRRNNTPW